MYVFSTEMIREWWQFGGQRALSKAYLCQPDACYNGMVGNFLPALLLIKHNNRVITWVTVSIYLSGLEDQTTIGSHDDRYLSDFKPPEKNKHSGVGWCSKLFKEIEVYLLNYNLCSLSEHEFTSFFFFFNRVTIGKGYLRVFGQFPFECLVVRLEIDVFSSYFCVVSVYSIRALNSLTFEQHTPMKMFSNSLTLLWWWWFYRVGVFFPLLFNKFFGSN